MTDEERAKAWIHRDLSGHDDSDPWGEAEVTASLTALLAAVRAEGAAEARVDERAECLKELEARGERHAHRNKGAGADQLIAGALFDAAITIRKRGTP